MIINSWLLWFISAQELETQKSDRDEEWKKEWKGRWSVFSLTSPPVPSTLGYRWDRGVLTAGMVSVLFLGVLHIAEQSLAKGWPLFSSLYHTPCSMAVATCSLSASSGPSDHRPRGFLRAPAQHMESLHTLSLPHQLCTLIIPPALSQALVPSSCQRLSLWYAVLSLYNCTVQHYSHTQLLTTWNVASETEELIFT